jgi:hypothetical protein
MEQRGVNTSNSMSGVVHGNVIQAGDVRDVHYHTGPSLADHQANGLLALGNKEYGTAVEELTRALRFQPTDAELHFVLALALLRGRRPHRVRSQRELDAVRHHLRQAECLPHAKLLRLLVEEDCGRHWERGVPVSGQVHELVGRADRVRAVEIAEHVAAPQNRVWGLIIDMVEGGGR